MLFVWLLITFLAGPALILVLLTNVLGRPENGGSFRAAFRELITIVRIGQGLILNLLIISFLIWWLLLGGLALFLWLWATKQLSFYDSAG
jgi:hypothetical protein